MVTANEKVMGGAGGDVSDWDEEGYRTTILQERELQCRTVFRVVCAPLTTPYSTPDILVAVASDGSIAGYAILSCISSSELPPRTNAHQQGPTYDVKFYGDGEDALLLSCGDDGRICGWKWKEILDSNLPVLTTGLGSSRILDLLNPQQRGPWNALSAIPENNAIDVNTQLLETPVLTAGTWRLVITGSEDGTARIWDCRSGKCTQVIYPGENQQLRKSTWVSCVSVDASKSWLTIGTGKNLSVWSLPSCECIWNIDTRVPIQDVHFDRNQILAVGSEPVLTRFGINGTVLSQIQCAPQSAFSISSHPSGVTAISGYGGLVDVISEYGSHLCTFSCKGM